jgi:hypothetical protein
MQRRQFLSSTLAASAATLTSGIQAQMQPSSSPPEFYRLTRYALQSGPQTALAEHYFGEALIPALTRMAFGPIGAFKLDIGPETPAYYLLVPGSSAEMLAEMDQHLSRDADFLKIAAPFWNAPATAPAFQRLESSLLSAFAGWPRVTPPASAASRGKRIFQLRTYESATHFDHARKVEMFHQGEFDIFLKAGFHPVFFGDTLVGPRTPNLTYMLSFTDMDELNAKWALFSTAPEWKKMKADPRFSYAEIVSNISNLILSPLASSQI